MSEGGGKSPQEEASSHSKRPFHSNSRAGSNLEDRSRWSEFTRTEGWLSAVRVNDYIERAEQQCGQVERFRGQHQARPRNVTPRRRSEARSHPCSSLIPPSLFAARDMSFKFYGV